MKNVALAVFLAPLVLGVLLMLRVGADRLSFAQDPDPVGPTPVLVEADQLFRVDADPGTATVPARDKVIWMVQTIGAAPVVLRTEVTNSTSTAPTDVRASILMGTTPNGVYDVLTRATRIGSSAQSAPGAALRIEWVGGVALPDPDPQPVPDPPLPDPVPVPDPAPAPAPTPAIDPAVLERIAIALENIADTLEARRLWETRP